MKEVKYVFVLVIITIINVHANSSNYLQEYNLYVFDLFKENKTEEIWNNSSEIMKAHIYSSNFNLENSISEISQNIGDIKFINSTKIDKISHQGRTYHKVVSDIDTERERVILTLILNEGLQQQLSIVDFDFWFVPRKPIHLFSFKYASLGHYLVFIVFILIIIIQVVCLILYFKFKPKRKWLYLILSFLGAPFGFKVFWTTLVFCFSFGFNIPAVGVTQFGSRQHISGYGAWQISFFFPLGIVFFIDLFLQRRKAKN